jgi:hypothetical protein
MLVSLLEEIGNIKEQRADDKLTHRRLMLIIFFKGLLIDLFISFKGDSSKFPDCCDVLIVGE